LKPCLDSKGALKHNETNLNTQSQLTDACNAIQGLRCEAACGREQAVSEREFSGSHGGCLWRCDDVLSDRNLTTFRTKSLPNFQHGGSFFETSVSFYQTVRLFNIILKCAPLSTK